MESTTMFERFSRSFALAGSSWHVLRQDKKLVVFPIVSGIACLFVLLSFAIPMTILAIQGHIPLDDGSPPWWTYVVAFAYYFCSYFVIIFCNAALISCTLMHFNGEQPTLNDGFQAAGARLPQIFAWAVVSATVGVLLKIIENVHEKVGEIVSAVLGTAWTVITYFVVPVLVVEKVGPFEAISRSVAILKKTWGEALIGNLGLGLFMLLLSLPGILLLVLGFLLANQTLALGLTVVALGLVYLLGCSVISSALSTIFLSALYQYAAYEKVPVGFNADDMRSAFRPKK
jgi:hypothetical protein